MLNKFNVPGTIPDFWERAALLPRETVQLDDPKRSPTRFLSQVERATVHVEVPGYEDAPITNSILGEALVRLVILEKHAIVRYASGHYLAEHLQRIFYSRHPAAGRYSRRGWILLAALDAANLAEVTLSAEPFRDDPLQRFRRMRMSARLEELSQLEPARKREMGQIR